MNQLFRFVNPIVVIMSKTLLHWCFSHQVMVLHFSGRRSGKLYAIPVSYLRISGESESRILCMTDARGVWWKNLQDTDLVTATVRGKQISARVKVEAQDTQKIADALDKFCRRSRVSAFFSGVGREGGVPNSADLTAAAARNVLIELTPSEP